MIGQPHSPHFRPSRNSHGSQILRLWFWISRVAIFLPFLRYLYCVFTHRIAAWHSHFSRFILRLLWRATVLAFYTRLVFVGLFSNFDSACTMQLAPKNWVRTLPSAAAELPYLRASIRASVNFGCSKAVWVERLCGLCGTFPHHKVFQRLVAYGDMIYMPRRGICVKLRRVESSLKVSADHCQSSPLGLKSLWVTGYSRTRLISVIGV